MAFLKKKKKDEMEGTLATYPHLMAMKPKERYVFHSDYFEIDGSVATIMSFFHQDGANDNFGVFWGINRIPSGLSSKVSVTLFEQNARMSDGWINSHQTKAEGVADINATEQHRSGTNTTRGKASRRVTDLEQISRELNDGDAYLHTQWRLMVKAPTLEELDEAVSKIEHMYQDRFGTVTVAAYHGEQKRELSRLMARNDKKLGDGFYFTSSEFAGAYSLVTHGLEDPHGEYVGYMVGDVNNSAVLFDVNKYKHHIIVANEAYNRKGGRVRVADMWGSKISQSCLCHNGRVVHLLLSDTNMDLLGPAMKGITYKIDMSHGDVNMFEMFGEVDDELSIFPSQMQKLILMAEQAYETTDSDRSVIRGELQSVATRFYVDNKMWRENAAANREKLRLVGIPHEQVPKLELFVSYLDTAHQKLLASSKNDTDAIHALKVLSTTFRGLLSANGDLFNTTTTSVIDGAKRGRRVLYDFRGLRRRGSGVAMAQLVNIIGFAIGNLGENDTLIVHGAEMIVPSVKQYMTEQLEHLYAKGGRVCYIYHNMEAMLNDRSFCNYDTADYTVFGEMTDNVMTTYERSIGQDIPADLKKLVMTRGESVCYIRRGFDNVVFTQDLSLGIPKRTKKGVDDDDEE